MTDKLASTSHLKPATITNHYWWIIIIVGILTIGAIATVCIVRGKQFNSYVVLGKSWYGTTISVGCK